MSRRRRVALACASIVVLLLSGASVAAKPFGVAVVSPDLVLSQVYGGGGNTGAPYSHDFIEIFNRGTTSVPLGGLSLQYASATGTGQFGANSTLLTELPDVSLAPGRYLLVQEASGGAVGASLPAPFVTDSSPINMSASSGKVVLARGTTSLGCNGGLTPCNAEQLARIIDLVGYGSANFFEGSGSAPGVSNATSSARNLGGCMETDDNAADFSAIPPSPRNADTTPNFCSTENAPSVTSTSPAAGATGVARNANVIVNFGEDVTVAAGWYAINCATSGAHPATQTGGPRSFTLDPTTDFATGETCTVAIDGDLVSDVDALDPPDTASDHTFSFTVFAPPPVSTIGSVQGPVSDTADGARHASPRRGQSVTVQGVIYQKTIARTNTGGSLNGFFVQNTAATADTDPTTSDGIFVYMAGFTDLIGGYVPRVGDEVVITGSVQEDFNFTRIQSARLELLVREGVNLDAELAPFVANPSDNLADANRYWERREGMRGQVPAGSVAVDGRDVFPSTMDGEVWVVRGDHPIMQRTNDYARRSFRDPHPLDNVPEQLFDDGNGYRIMMASLGLKGATGNNNTLIAPSRTFDTMTNAPVGGVYFAFSKYSIQVGEQPVFTHGADPSLNAPPTAGNRRVEYSVGDYNVENLYDFRDDPFDGCDFAGNPGCTGVNPPFDYVPASEEAYETRLGLQAQQIIQDLHAPDVLLVQEAEDQDICVVAGGELSCGATNNADGKPDTLQELALAIRAAGGPAYDAAFDRDGSDDRGIVAALMYRTDRVQLLTATADHPVLGSSPDVEYETPGNAYNSDVQNPKALNAPLPARILAEPPNRRDGVEVYTRDPQVGLFRIWRVGVGRGGFTDVYAISNHFSSTPDNRVNQRREQARYLANIVDALGEDAQVVAGGDFNVYPRPDDPLIPPSDQLAPLYEQGLTNLWDVLVAQAPTAAYSYVFIGMAQTLDGQFVTDNVFDDLVQTRVAHVNADFPADYDGDGARGLSDHDPLSSRFGFTPTLPRLTALLEYHRADASEQAYRALSERLDRAERFAASGQMSAYRAQLLAFANQALGFAPNHLSADAADSLAGEADLLRTS